MPSPAQGDQGGRDYGFCSYHWGQEIESNISPSGLIEQLHRMRDGLLIMMTTHKLQGFSLSRRRLVFLFYAVKTWFYNTRNNKRQTPGSGRPSMIQYSDQHTCTCSRRRQSLACSAPACAWSRTQPLRLQHWKGVQCREPQFGSTSSVGCELSHTWWMKRVIWKQTAKARMSEEERGEVRGGEAKRGVANL